MIIAIDGNEANVRNRVGSNRFAFEVLWGLYKKAKDQKKIRVLVFLQDQPLRDLPPETSGWHYEVFGPKKFWTWTGLVKRLYFGRPRPDVLFSPSHYGPLMSPVPFIVSIMDLGFLRWPEQFTRKDFYQLKYWTKLSIRRAKKIIAISKFTRDDIIETYHLEPSKVVVSYPGFNKDEETAKKLAEKRNQQQKLKEVKQKYGINREYIFYLGTLKPSKNVEGLIRAYRLAKDCWQIKPQLVIAGKKGWLYGSIFRLVEKLNLKNQVIFTGFVSDEESEILMRGAKIFALPSFWEGFGIPALEAMAAGTPVLASDRGALPEIIGEAGLFINLDRVENIACGLKKLLTNEKLRRRLQIAGRKRRKLFSWRRCSKIIWRVILSVAKTTN